MPQILRAKHTVVLMLITGVCGYFLGLASIPRTREVAEANKSGHASSRIATPGSRDGGSTKPVQPFPRESSLGRKVEFSSAWGVVPASALASSSLRLLLPGRLEIDTNRATLVGVDAERTAEINVLLNALEQKVKDYEEKNVTKSSSPDGDFYSVRASHDMIKEFDATVAAIRQRFEDNPPLGEGLLTAVFHGTNFSSFGKFDEEISIRDVSSGGRIQTVAEVVLRDPTTGNAVGGRNATLNPSVLQTRYPFFGIK